MDLKTRQALFESAYNLQANGQYDKAVEELKKVLHIDPNYIEAHYLLGNVYNLLGNTDKANMCYQQVLKIDPMYSKAKYMLDLMCDEGKCSYNIVEERQKSKEAEVYFYKGVEYFNARSFEEAIEAFRKAVEIFPEYHQAYYNLGVVYYHTGDIKRAEDFWKKTLDYDLKNPKVFLNLGILAYKNGKTEEAVSLWEKIVADNIPLAQVYYNLSVIYNERGDSKKAKEFLDKALNMNPDYKTAIESIEKLNG